MAKCAATILALLFLEGLAAADCPATAVRYASSSNRLYISGPVTCTPTDLDPIVSHAVLERTSKFHKIWILRASVILQGGATLVLRGDAVGGDVNQLRLRSNDAAGDPRATPITITADWGNLVFDHVHVTSWNDVLDSVDLREPYAWPYIVARSRLVDATARESRMDINLSTFVYLGTTLKSEQGGVAWVATGDGVVVRGGAVESRFQDSYLGAYVSGGDGVQLLGNIFANSAKTGVSARASSGLVLVDNDISSNAGDGFRCTERCDGLDLRNNRSFWNGASGYAIRRCTGAPPAMQDNSATENGEAGLALIDCDGAVIRFNTFSGNKKGVRLSVASSDNLLERNRIEDNTTGIYVYPTGEAPLAGGDGHPRRNTFQNNTLRANARVVYMQKADDNELISNIVSQSVTKSDGAFLFLDAQDNVLAGNIIPEDALIHSRGTSRTILTQAGFIPQAQAPVLVKSGDGATTVFVETSTLTHMRSGGAVPSTATPTETTLVAEDGLYSTVAVFARPQAGSVIVTPEGATAWTAEGTATVTTTVGRLTPGASYLVRRNGAALVTVTANGSGVVTFTDGITGSTRYTVAPAP